MRFLPAALGSALAFVSLSPTAFAQDIAPPPPIDPNQPGAPTAPTNPDGTPSDPSAVDAGETKRRLDEAERQDSKRNFELFWINPQVGASYINMNQVSDSTLQLEKAASGGPMFSLGAGVRFVVLVLGARARYNALSAFNMWQVNLEAGLKFPTGSWDILIGGHGGYSFVGSLGEGGAATNQAIPRNDDAVKIRGWNAGLELGFDYYISPAFSVGLGFLTDFLFLNRPPLEPNNPQIDALPQAQRDAARAAIANDPAYQQSGTSVGMQFAGGLRLGLHIGL
jgi:hypothetical protein